MPEALAAVKHALGPDAVILGTRTLPAEGLPGLGRRGRVEITASAPDPLCPRPRPGGHVAARPGPPAQVTAPANAAPPPAALPEALPAGLYRHYVGLVQSEVAAELAEQIVRRAAAGLREQPDEDAIQSALREQIGRLVPSAPGLALTPGRTHRVALVGPSGSGKTTTAAKLAALFRLRQKADVALLSLDMHRLDAHGHLRRLADVLEIPLYTAQTIGEVKAALAAAAQADLLLIDTPGVGLREQGRFARLATLLRSARPDEIHLVLPASLAPEVQQRLARGFAPLSPARVVLTRLDDVVGLGVVVNVVARLGLSVSYLSSGQNVPRDLQEACGPRLADVLCRATG